MEFHCRRQNDASGVFFVPENSPLGTAVDNAGTLCVNDEDVESAVRAVEPEVIVIDEDDCFGGNGGVLIDVTN